MEQIRLRLDPAELRGLDEAIEQGGDLGAALGAGAIVILPSHDDPAEAPLGGVVIEGDPRVLEERVRPRHRPSM
jgi:hypothetical protein